MREIGLTSHFSPSIGPHYFSEQLSYSSPCLVSCQSYACWSGNTLIGLHEGRLMI